MSEERRIDKDLKELRKKLISKERDVRYAAMDKAIALGAEEAVSVLMPIAKGKRRVWLSKVLELLSGWTTSKFTGVRVYL